MIGLNLWLLLSLINGKTLESLRKTNRADLQVLSPVIKRVYEK
jgi:hypothetical protein